jgi:hypothetical protein
MMRAPGWYPGPGTGSLLLMTGSWEQPRRRNAGHRGWRMAGSHSSGRRRAPVMGPGSLPP